MTWGPNKSRPAERTGDSRGWLRFLRGFLSRRDGAVAVQFAILALPLAVLSLGLIDVNRASMSKRILQDALDASALIVARSDADTDAEANAIGQQALVAQLAASGEGVLIASSFSLGGTNGSKVVASASASVDPVVADLWLQGDMTVGAKTEVMRSSANLEVSLVLDVTGSMGGSRIADLQTAAEDLVDLVVQPVQTPYYSKLAIVPYSMGVNLGSRADKARGPVLSTANLSDAGWADGESIDIDDIDRSRPAKVTAPGHGFSNGDYVWIERVKGMTELNDRAYRVTNVTRDTFELSGVDARWYDNYKSSKKDKVTRCQARDCEVVVTARGHGFADGDQIQISNVNGMSELNDETWTVDSPTGDTFALADTRGPDFSNYRSGGAADCLEPGCQYYRFTSASGRQQVYEITDCVTERVGADAYTDASPASAPVGRNYLSDPDGCLNSEVKGLSSDKASLKKVITDLKAGGSTAGQIGLAWGWYTVSPNFSSIFGGTSQPAPYGTKDLLKVVILMTDGEFNTAYCNGVVSEDSSNGYSSSKINCDATNGDPFDQAASMCEAMKAKGIIIYTVGFDISSSRDVSDLLSNCASGPDHFYQPASGSDLKEAFKAIGKDISNLRISS
ncbi:MAG: pilus assembly protein TadG [Caulobacter sp.]|nr:pilus assembly protein TadG [Caulobacter sp.]